MTIGRPPNTVVLEFEKSQALANCFPIFDNISISTILSLLTIMMYHAVHKLDRIFGFSCLFLMSIARLV